MFENSRVPNLVCPFLPYTSTHSVHFEGFKLLWQVVLYGMLKVQGWLSFNQYYVYKSIEVLNSLF